MKSVRTVLLIDDNPSCNFIMSEFIKLVDSAIVTLESESVSEALEILEKGETSFPDVIYVDINMPVQDGFDFLRVFEERYKSMSSETRVFMLSSSLRPEDQDKAVEFDSVTSFVSKNDIDTVLKQTLYPTS